MENEIYIKGFNQGYELAQVNNDLALSVINNIDGSSSDRLQYFREGVLEYEKEKLYQKLKREDKTLDKDSELDLGKD